MSSFTAAPHPFQHPSAPRPERGRRLRCAQGAEGSVSLGSLRRWWRGRRVGSQAGDTCHQLRPSAGR
eukprot:9346058-Pyramimonas_sp.AAC.1